MTSDNTKASNSFKFPLLITILSVLVLLLIGVVVGIYFFTFNGPIGDQEQFGQFGDYIGGVLNPILSFLTIALLIWSIQVQTKELRASTDELSKSSKALDAAQTAHNENVELQKRENLRRQIQDDFEYHWRLCEQLFNKGLIEIGTKKRSLAEMAFDDNIKTNTEAKKFIESIPSRMAFFSVTADTPSQTLFKIEREIDYMTNSVSELFKLLDTGIVASSIHHRVWFLITDCDQLGMLDQFKFNTYTGRISIPQRLGGPFFGPMPSPSH